MASKRNIERHFKANRPPAVPGRLDQHLPGIAWELREMLAETQETFIYPACQLGAAALDELAIALVEFAEDIHADAGLWRALESYQSELFGTPLPLFLKSGEPLAGRFDPPRVLYFLYILWRQFQPEYLLAPDHSDLAELAGTAGAFLSASFRGLPKDSSVARFLRTPNRRGWEVKRKLVWAGRHSYLFRHECASYHKENGADLSDIDTTDDFICQHSTDWCGFGVIDLLACALDLPNPDRAELRTWYERHNAPYRVLEIAKRGAVAETMNVINLVNDQSYRIRIEMERCPFVAGQVVIGSLVPWHGEWYWSGGQRMWQKTEAAMLAVLKKEYLEKQSSIAYRYCPDLAQKARDTVREHHRAFVSHHGDDLAVFPDGLSLAAAQQVKMRALFNQRPKEIVEDVMKRHSLRNPWPTLQFPDELLNHRDGVGAFFNSDEGEEWMLDFNQVLSAFRKQGAALTDDEAESIRGMIESENISPAFVQRLVREHGCGAIGCAFMIRDFQETPDLAWLLRRFKGKFYRKRYPAISFAQGEAVEAES
jgi:Protein of unknown function (DUF3843)